MEDEDMRFPGTRLIHCGSLIGISLITKDFVCLFSSQYVFMEPVEKINKKQIVHIAKGLLINLEKSRVRASFSPFPLT